jgi:ABC-type sugar transport system permease subunit
MTEPRDDASKGTPSSTVFPVRVPEREQPDRCCLVSKKREQPDGCASVSKNGVQRRPPRETQVAATTRRGERWAYLYLAPAFVALGVFVFWPLVQTLGISFFEWNLVSPKRHFVGLENYRALLSDPSFAALIAQSLLYMALALVGNFLLPVGLALLTLQLSEREADLFQALLFIPAVVAVSIGVLIWLWFYLPTGGLFNAVGGALGLPRPAWLTDPSLALGSVSLAANWKFLGFNYLIALAGLRAIPREYLEAARVDGAVGWPLVRRIVLPMFAPSAVFLMVSTLLQSLEQVFVPIEVLTVGGPAGATGNLMYTVYQEGFKFFRAGRAAASSVVLIAGFAGLIIWQFRLFERRVSYER